MTRILMTPLVIIILIPLTIIGLMKGLNLRISYPYNFYRSAVDPEQVIHSFGKFSVAEDYRLRVATTGKEGENRLAVYVRESTNQKLFISILREHLHCNLERVNVLDKTKVEETFRQSAYESRKIYSFRFIYALPLLLRKDDLPGMGDEAIIKGIHVKAKERFDTPFAEVFYVTGIFSQVGLFKESKGRWPYATPVFDFGALHEGALALIKSKKSGRVIVAVGVNSLDQFREKEFREFINGFDPT
jgi:hypothetical protein